ncbi:MAG: hypothetical protein ACYC8T_04520 [Myxococcaceae bacterium]
MTSRRIALAAAAFFLVSATAYAQKAPEDKQPNGCVDCHKGDTDLQTIMAKWKTEVPASTLAIAKKAAPEGMNLKGKHPDVAAKKNIPKDCLTCHKAGSKMAPSLASLAHLNHLTGDTKKFVELGGSCASCHKVNPDNGSVVLKTK